MKFSKLTKAMLMAAAMTVLSAGQVLALNERGDFTRWGENDFQGTVKIHGVELTSTAAELNIMDGVTATAAGINRAANISAGQRALTVTNGQAITLSASNVVVALTSQGGADGTTNTVTIATPYPVGYEFTFRVTSGSTNLVTIADSTTVLSLGAAVVLGATDTLKIYTAATNEAVKISTSDN